MFKNTPGTKEMFHFLKGTAMSQLNESLEFLFLGARTLKYIERALQNLDHLPNIVSLLREVGRNHAAYNMKVDYFPVSRNSGFFKKNFLFFLLLLIFCFSPS